MIYLLFVLAFMSQYTFSMLQDEVRALSSKRYIAEITGKPSTTFTPKLVHAVQNNVIITLLVTSSTEYTRTFNLVTKRPAYSARFYEDNSKWNALAAEKSFYELIAIHKLNDETAEQIMARCNQSRKAHK
jgi:hypothetical protein